MLVFVVGAAAALLLSAPALGAAWLTTEQPVIAVADVQQSAALAVDPSAPGRAVAVADDGTAASAFPRTLAAMATDWTSVAWGAPSPLPHSGSTSAGHPDVAWGVDDMTTQNVYAVEEDATGGSTCTALNSGVFFSASDDGGLSWDTAAQISSGSSSARSIEPAIAVDRVNNRIYVAYSKLEYATTGCPGTPDSSQIILLSSDNGGTLWSARRVSPLAPSGFYRSPALAVLPDGRVIVAFRNDSATVPQIETETCSLYPAPLPGANYCNPPSAGLVGPSTVVGEATAPAFVSGLAGPPTPSIVAAGDRVTVAWHSTVGATVRAFAAMSTDNGLQFGGAEPIDSKGAGNQVAPRLAATADGRVDVAYLWDVSGGGIVSATSVSAAKQVQPATAEAWANPVVVQAIGASATSGITPQGPPLGRRLGVATAAVSTALSPLPATLVAFTDTSNAATGQDVRVVGLLHGTTAPVIGAQTVEAHKNLNTIVQVDATDDDGDPLTWSAGAQPANPDSHVTISDAARGAFNYKAANAVGPDTFEAIATDGLHVTQRTINVNVLNDRPEIVCSSLVTPQNTTLAIPLDPTGKGCATDPNGDSLTFDLDGAVGGKVERASGTWRFVPTQDRTDPGSFVLHVSDGDLTTQATVMVTILRTTGKVDLQVKDAKKRRVIARGMAVRLSATAVDNEGRQPDIFWDFGDKTPVVRGKAVAHRFRKERTYTVTATAGDTTVPIKVVVRRRAVEIMAPPLVADGVLQVRVRTRVAGKLLFRVDSRSHTISIPAGSSERTLQIQVTSGPLARLILRLTPSKATTLPMLRVRQLVLVSPLSAG